MAKKSLLFFAVIFCAAVLIISKYVLPGVVEEAALVPEVANSKLIKLDAKIYRPSGEGPYPLVIITHGRGNGAADNSKIRPDDYRYASLALAKKNFVVLSLVRRGYGKSEGEDAEDFDRQSINVYRVGMEGAKDVQAAIAFMKAKPYVDSSKILLAGHSTGGCVVLAASTLNIPGLSEQSTLPAAWPPGTVRGGI